MRAALIFCWLSLVMAASAQQVEINPQVRTKTTAAGGITVVEVVPHFVSTIRVPEPANSIVVGDPALFQVEHSEREPELVFVKALTTGPAESNLLISTTKGRQISFLLVSTGRGKGSHNVDFLLRYQTSGDFLVQPEPIPFALIPPTTALPIANSRDPQNALQTALLTAPSAPKVDATQSGKQDALDRLLERQKHAPLPALYGERIKSEHTKGVRLRAGISEILDGGEQVIVLFSVVNTSKHPVLLMPPQVQLGGKDKSGKLIRRKHWSTAEQLAVIDFRLSPRRIGPGDRADGVVLFERPPYKRSNETLFLQMAESGAVDKPALAPIGFGVSTLRDVVKHAQ